MLVGEQGHGSVTIKDGAFISNRDSVVGNKSTGDGSVDVDGATWHVTGDLGVAREGVGKVQLRNGGTLIVDGLLEIELAALDSFDVLAVSGTGTLDYRLRIALRDGFDPLLGSHFDILLSNRGINGAFADFISPHWQDKRYALDTSDTHRLWLVVADVPVPASIWLLASAATLLRWRGAAARPRVAPLAA